MNSCMLYVTVGSPLEARKIAKTLVSEHLAACANIVDGVASVYRWEEQIQEDSESVLIAKTSSDRRQAATKRIKELHSYDVPCILAYDITDGLPEYLAWIGDQTRRP